MLCYVIFVKLDKKIINIIDISPFYVFLFTDYKSAKEWEVDKRNQELIQSDPHQAPKGKNN